MSDISDGQCQWRYFFAIITHVQYGSLVCATCLIALQTMRVTSGFHLLCCSLTMTTTVALQPHQALTRSKAAPINSARRRQSRLFAAVNDEILDMGHLQRSKDSSLGTVSDEDNGTIDKKCRHNVSLDEETSEEIFVDHERANEIALLLRTDDSTYDRVNVLTFGYALYDLSCAAVVGIVTGLTVAVFKLSIEAVRLASYSLDILDTFHEAAVFIPALGGLLVGAILLFGNLPPGLRGTVTLVDEDSKGPAKSFLLRLQMLSSSLRKSTAAVFTLGTGCSLGPEGPCVEIGMGIARSFMDIGSSEHAAAKRRVWNRVLLSCGAAAGVAAGFDAPVAGVFFALEVMQSTISDVTEESRKKGETDALGSSAGLFASTSTITPVVLASVLSALCARSILGQHLTFKVSTYSLPTSLLELPMYLLLGATCGCVAFAFSEAAKFCQAFFNGDVGNHQVRSFMQTLSPSMKPVIGGLFCGFVALFVPQILFFGYETMNPLLSNTLMPTNVLLAILLAKSVATAVSVGSGLVGGTFAPALFLGGVTGASFHNIMSSFYQLAAVSLSGLGVGLGGTLTIAGLPAYAMVGSASVLAALFRAPLTASLLLFELSRDYDVILPLIASAGVGSIVADILEDKFEKEKARRRDQDSASWGDLSDRKN